MKNALEWIKSNPISVASAAVAFIGLLVIAYFYLLGTSAFQTRTAEQLKGPYGQQQTLARSTVPLPNEDPNAPPTDETVVINQQVIQEVQQIYNKIRDQYDDILRQTNNKNSQGHLVDRSRSQSVLLARGAIFPKAQLNSSYEQAKQDYLTQHEALFTFGQDQGWNMPSFRAGSPPLQIEIQRELARTAFNFVNSIGVTSANELSQEQAEQLYAEQRMVLMKMLTDRARSIHLYVSLPREQDIFAPPIDETETDPAIGGGPIGGEFGGEFGGPIGGGFGQQNSNQAAGYPFVLMPWVFAPQTPNPDEAWEGQVQLWIIRDIMKAIHKQNNVANTRAAGTYTDTAGKPRTYIVPNVIDNPIKRLLVCEVVPGYVGLHTTGGVIRDTTAAGFDAGGSTDNRIQPIDITVGRTEGSSIIDVSPSTGADTTRQRPSVYPTPPAELAPLDPKEKAPEHFGITPTGRVSNSVFDVRHTRLVIDIQWEALPGFIEELRDINFMTVIGLKLQDIDEYKVLREGGYVYGDDDVVRAELIIESLWFRDWTAKHMPQSVKQKLLIIQPEDSAGGLGTPGGFGTTDGLGGP
ncbi:MAG: hypothetical protein ACE37H_16820 [Phycisphaeraceae bacterium]